MSSEEYYWYPPRVTIYKDRAGNWVQALVQHRKTTGPDGTRLQILKKLQTIPIDK